MYEQIDRFSNGYISALRLSIVDGMKYKIIFLTKDTQIGYVIYAC